MDRLGEELKLAEEEKSRCIIQCMPYFDNVKGYATGMHNAIEIVKEVGGLDD